MKFNFFRHRSKLWSQAGFTLMEIIVALGIFSIASTASISVFIRSNLVQKRTANIQRVVSDARYALEVMAREVRMGSIDYSYSGYLSPLPFLQTQLALTDADDQPLRFRRYEVATGRFAIQVCYGLAVCGDTDWLDITPGDLTITRLDFYISPAKNPFVWDDSVADYPNDQQPRVTIVMESQSLNRDIGTPKISNFQTSVTSRKYVR